MKAYPLLFILLCAMIPGVYAHPGIGILEDSKGNVFYTDLKQVWRISPSGQKSIAVPNVHTHELYIDEHDNLYGEHLWYNGEQKDTWGHFVWKLAASGKFEKVIPDTEGFLENYSFVRDHLGRMYFASRTNPCQKVLRSNGTYASQQMGHDCFENIRKIQTAPDGSIIVVDFQDLKRIDSQGKTTTVAKKIANKAWTKATVENQNAVMGVWGDRDGNLYAAVSNDRTVKKFSRDGKEEVSLKTAMPWAPSGGMVDSQGRLWVLEYNLVNDVRVERIDQDGRKTVY